MGGAEAPLSDEDVRYQAELNRAKALQGWIIHLFVYVVVNAGLLLINALTRGDDGSWWFYWPLLGWGIGLAIHTATMFVGLFSPDWAERRARERVERHLHAA